MKKVILLRSNQIIGDSRVQKYLSFFEEENINYYIIGWDRKRSNIDLKNATFFKRRCGYVAGGLKAAYNRIFWFIFIIKNLLKYKKENIAIHACDLDTAFPAALYKFFFHRKTTIIFDIFDWMSADYSALLSNCIIKKSIILMEQYSLKQSNYIIVCEKERACQITNSEKLNLFILPNIPMLTVNEKFQIKQEYNFDNSNLTLSYVGYFGHGRFLDELLDIAETEQFNILIAGYGDNEIEKKCMLLSNNQNVKFFGRVDYHTSLEIMYNSDIVYAMYCNVINAHYYAAPNKYYEAMLLGKPIITTEGIIVGNKVKENDIGYVIKEEKKALVDLIKSIDMKDMKEKGRNAKNLWDNKYNRYTRDFLNNQYLDFLKN